jgi:hypothetical protein
MSRVGLGDKFRNAVVSIVANGEISGSQLKGNVVKTSERSFKLPVF